MKNVSHNYFVSHIQFYIFLMKFDSANIGKIYTIEDISVGIPCENCNPCLRLRLMELGFIGGEKIQITGHRMGIWTIDVLSENNSVAYTIALRDEEADRVCLLD